MIDGAVLREHPGAQTLLIRGDGDIFAAYGRTADMKAWLADTDYNHVTMSKKGTLDVELVPATTQAGDDASAKPAPSETPAAGDGGADAPPADEAAGRNPSGSDLWLDSYTDKDALIADDLMLPEGVSMLVAYDGSKNAPDDITVSWPLDTSTPAAGPLVASGVVVLLIGLVLYILGIRHQRRGRGPRRKGPGPLPVTEPIDLEAIPAADRAAISGSGSRSADAPDSTTAQQPGEKRDGDAPAPDGKSERRARPVRRRRMLALPALGVTVLLAAGCSADSWPQLGTPSAEPSPTPTVIAPENQKPPAVTESQAARILGAVSSTLSQADAAMDIELAKTRLDGAALAARTTEYTLRAAIPETPAPAAIPTEDVQVILPEATDRWPRTVLMVSKNKAADDSPQVLLTMTQADPWSNYKVTNIADVSSDKLELNVAAAWLGTSLVPADSAFLSIAPGKLAAAFSDVVDEADKSASASSFDEQTLSLAQSIRDSRQGVVQRLADGGAAETSQATFDMTPYEAAPPVALTTLDSGAIVGVAVVDTQRVTPTSPDAVIKFDDNAEAKALTGVSESKSGIESTYIIQLFFAVPAQGSTEQIRLLGYHQDVLGGQVIK
jgi:hypothetical protein